jgi:hypothetical protein
MAQGIAIFEKRSDLGVLGRGDSFHDVVAGRKTVVAISTCQPRSHDLVYYSHTCPDAPLACYKIDTGRLTGGQKTVPMSRYF